MLCAALAPLLCAAVLCQDPVGPPAGATAREVVAFYLADREPLIPAWRAATAGDDPAAGLAAVAAVRDAEAAALAAAEAGLAEGDARRGAVLAALRAELIGSHRQLAARREAAGEWAAAERELAAALTLTEATHGPDDWRTGDARRAVEHLRRRRGLTDEQRARLADMRIADAAMMTHYRAGRYGAAADRARASLAATREVFGPRHPDTAASLDALAVMLASAGGAAAARPLYEEALAIRRDVLGPRHPHTAGSLNNLGFLLASVGELSAARSLYEEALDIRREAPGPRHPDTAVSLNNLALLLKASGDLAAARPLYEEALDIRREAFGPRHPDTAQSLNNLAALLKASGDLAAARPLYEEALVTFRAVRGPRHPDTATILNNVASLLRSSGDFAAARPLYEDVLSIRREVFGPRHPATLESLNNLALLLKASGRLAAARPLYEEALSGHREAFGPRHPATAASLHNLAALRADLGEVDAARTLSAEAVAATLELLEETAASQGGGGQRDFAADRRFVLDGSLSLTAGDADAAGPALAWKGAVLARRLALARVPDTPDLAAAKTDLRRVGGELAALSLNPPGDDARRAAWRARLDELAAERGRLERTLSAASAAYRLAADVTPADLSAALPAGTALVDVHAYWHRAAAPDRADGRPEFGRRLTAFLHRPGAAPVRVDLGPEKPAAEIIDAWRAAVVAGDPAADIDAIGRELRDRLWDPLAPLLADADTVLVSPDGPFCRLPLAALPGEEPGSYLLEERAFAAVPVPRLLPLLLSGEPTAATTLLAVGGVDYDAGAASAAAPGVQIASRAVPRGAFGRFAPLAGTGPEATAVLATAEAVGLGGEALIRAEATEANLRRLAPGAGILHLATHGYFAPPDLRSRLAPRELGEDAATGLMRTERDLAGYAPGLLSGLALAGANASRHAEARPGLGVTAGHDGLLTAEEVAGLDLRTCRLAVLSACETGLGETAGGEGLLGLQRAFTAAGAGATVAGMWPVPDEPTRTLMTRFHRNRWERGMPTLAALREAQLWVLSHPAESGATRGVGTAAPAEDDRGRSHPAAWAGWVLSGDWR